MIYTVFSYAVVFISISFMLYCSVKTVQNMRGHDMRKSIISTISGLLCSLLLTYIVLLLIIFCRPVEKVLLYMAELPYELFPYILPYIALDEVNYMLRLFHLWGIVLAVAYAAGKLCTKLLGTRGVPGVIMYASFSMTAMQLAQPYIVYQIKRLF